MRIDNKSKQECCGCGACVTACRYNAISMTVDNLGFLYPRINIDKCVDCGLCGKVCQFSPDYKKNKELDTPFVYALRTKDENRLNRSQSGGAFSEIATYIISHKGVVYGAAFETPSVVKHIRIESKKDLQLLQGSKYVQSDIRGIYDLVIVDLKAGRKVLFSGTACQVSGLRAIVPSKLIDNLFLVDIICHGVPSPRIWSDYIAYLEKKMHSTVITSNFRDKRYGWNNAQESYIFDNGKECISHRYLDLYFGHYISRDCCKCCPYTNTDRVGDLTIGDFWGWYKHHTEFDDNKGISLVLVNNNKGVAIMNAIKDDVTLIQSNIKECLQPKLQHPTEENPNKEEFLKYYEKKGFSFVLHRYTAEGWRLKLKLFIAKLIRYKR